MLSRFVIRAFRRVTTMATEDLEKVQRLVWVDCEMTGLRKPEDTLVEVAVIVTDKDLNVRESSFLSFLFEDCG